METRIQERKTPLVVDKRSELDYVLSICRVSTKIQETDLRQHGPMLEGKVRSQKITAVPERGLPSAKCSLLPSTHVESSE